MRTTRSRMHIQHGWWFYGSSSFEIHSSLHQIFYDGWDPEMKKTVPGRHYKKMEDAVHNCIKNQMKANVIPHIQVL